MKSITIAGITGFVMLSACATPPEDIIASDVSPLRFAKFECDELAALHGQKEARLNDLHGKLKEEAKTDETQAAVGLILFWPALLFLEGEDSAETDEYARLKGEIRAINAAGLKNDCSFF